MLSITSLAPSSMSHGDPAKIPLVPPALHPHRPDTRLQGYSRRLPFKLSHSTDSDSGHTAMSSGDERELSATQKTRLDGMNLGYEEKFGQIDGRREDNGCGKRERVPNISGCSAFRVDHLAFLVFLDTTRIEHSDASGLPGQTAEDYSYAVRRRVCTSCRNRRVSTISARNNAPPARITAQVPKSPPTILALTRARLESTPAAAQHT
ncbi:hypothetical protein C8R45DRAFT_1151399 [Mycena sanguinolenta]|nr:hypothetical protein C8R45DRAFT_1151399 [Mycena sanguinolenta]